MSTTSAATFPSPTPPAAAYAEASPTQVRQWLGADKAILIDVREPDEFAREHIHGARLVPLSRFHPADAIALARPGQAVVMQCRSGKRSAEACRLACAAIAPSAAVSIYTLTGGIEAWKSARLPVITSAAGPRISVMRQVQLTIGALALVGSALAAFVHPAFAGIPAFLGAGLLFAGATGTCALASFLSRMPWNALPAGAAACPADGAARCSSK